jgi:hypothetical protein
MTSLTVVVDDRSCFGDVGENLEQFGWVGIGQPCGGWFHVRRRDRPGPSRGESLMTLVGDRR